MPYVIWSLLSTMTKADIFHFHWKKNKQQILLQGKDSKNDPLKYLHYLRIKPIRKIN